MTQEHWTAVDQYISNLFLPSDPVLESVLAVSAAAGLPTINVSPVQGRFLMLLAMAHGARTILEIGTLGGYSTIWLARALPEGGHLITIEADPRYAEVARRNIAQAGLADLVELRIGLAVDILQQLCAEERNPFDLIFIDADKLGYADYLDWALTLSHTGTFIIADNAVRKGAVVDETSGDPDVVGVQRFNQKLAAEHRVTATIIQLVGSKGHDGFALAVVTAN
jgi:predicted O-methyltransferase YrrM